MSDHGFTSSAPRVIVLGFDDALLGRVMQRIGPDDVLMVLRGGDDGTILVDDTNGAAQTHIPSQYLTAI